MSKGSRLRSVSLKPAARVAWLFAVSSNEPSPETSACVAEAPAFQALPPADFEALLPETVTWRVFAHTTSVVWAAAGTSWSHSASRSAASGPCLRVIGDVLDGR